MAGRRLQQAIDTLEITPGDIASASMGNVSVLTRQQIEEMVTGTRELSWSMLTNMHREYSVNAIWLMHGLGSMRSAIPGKKEFGA